MTYREDDEAPDTNMRSYLCMKAFPLEVGGMGENIEAHKWLNAMRKEGWHLVSMSTGSGEIPIPHSDQWAGGPTKRAGPFITFVMEGTKRDSQHSQDSGAPDKLGPVQDILSHTQSYGQDRW